MATWQEVLLWEDRPQFPLRVGTNEGSQRVIDDLNTLVRAVGLKAA